MDRPENIPEDVWTAATAANWCLFNLSEQDQRNGADIEIIARAILAAKAEERADIAETAEEFGMAAGEPALVTFADILRTNGDA